MTTEPQTITQVKGLIQYFVSRDEEKRTYLAWRICGFSPKDALKHTKVLPQTLALWLANDADFADMERVRMPQLRKEYYQEIIQESYVRNLHAGMMLDQTILEEALDSGVDALGKQAFEYLKQLRTQYDPKVRQALGLETSDETMPQSWEEIILTIRRSSNGPPKELTTPKNFIEGEYQESSVESNRAAGDAEADNAQEDMIDGEEAA